MNTAQLRQKILDLAIHGKLVNEELGNRNETLDDRRETLALQGAEGDLPRHCEERSDEAISSVPEEEQPFDLPQGWKWCRLGDVCEIIMGQSPEGSDISENTNGMEFHQGKIYFTDKYLEKSEKYTSKITKVAPENSILLCVRAPVGIVNITPRKVCIGRGLCSIYPKSGENTNFWFYWLQCQKENFNQKATGTTFKAISVETVKKQLIPLPPLTEQKQIVAKIEQIFSQIDILEQNKSSLLSSVKQAKRKILDMAIHGKLVDSGQLTVENCHTDSELLRNSIPEEEQPFELPQGWKWCRLGEIYNHTTGKALKKSNNNGTLRKYITTSNLYWNKFDFSEVRSMYFTDDELEKCTVKKGDLLVCNGGDVGRAAIWNFDKEICYQNHISRLRPKNSEINNKFYFYVIWYNKESGNLSGKGIGITSLSASDFLSLPVPLPPLTEQKQIVAKIEQMFSALDKIQAAAE